MKLIALPKKQRAVITGIDADLPLKLMEMGVVKGADIVFLGNAPFGSPYYYRLDHSHIALGKELCEKIEIKILP